MGKGARFHTCSIGMHKHIRIRASAKTHIFLHIAVENTKFDSHIFRSAGLCAGISPGIQVSAWARGNAEQGTVPGVTSVWISARRQA